ncbi:hypothetical protein WJT86_06165 [Microvirga sp. W0021]|uniref:Uncharacterized protein n=1 Tax=Hohaiivirga grylli TaxID=3133970 RepID=A0ABV0BI33_9HYPH
MTMNKQLNQTDTTFIISLRTRDGTEALEVIAAITNYNVALAAYEQALLVYPRQRIALKQGNNVLREHLVPGMGDLGTDFA